ncbi:SGNH/GDSL hydrolase family protein [Streptomyces poriticola]|uniref:SGNH/GDSL hydrolase family protein n=1 Tax=Streptomyces poriticola TaxID=3120506 RepID=UPI002FCE3127
MRRAWVAGLLLGGVLLGGCQDPASEPAGPPPTAPGGPATTHRRAAAGPDAASPSSSVPANPPRVLYLGDSLAMENQQILGQELRERLRAAYTSAPYSGTTLCDYLEGVPGRSLVPARHKAAALVRSVRPDVVVLQFWGNSWGYTPCMDQITYDASRRRYAQRFEADARRLTEQIAAAGGAHRPRIVWVLQGPDPVTPERVRLVNGVYERAARASGDLVADAGRTVSRAGARYAWVQHLPCTEYERARAEYCTEPARDRAALHRDDDHLHFCLAPTTSTPRPCPVRSPGILRMAREITRVVGEGAALR